MNFSKRIFAVLLCCGLLFNQPAKAFWPVFDFTEIVPIYSQVSTGINQLKSLKEQLKELEETLKAVGKEVNNLSAFSKNLTDTISNAASVVSDAASLANENLGTNIELGEKAENLAGKVSEANNEVSKAVVGASNNIATGANSFGSEVDKGGKLLGKAEAIDNKAKKYIVPESQNSETNEEATEEEEEEEEVSPKEDMEKINALKENIGFALEESKSLKVQFDDVMDISINTIHQNIEKNNAIFDNMGFVVEKAENLTDNDKKILKEEIKGFKQRQENLSINLVGIIEGIKDSYGKQYKNKIEDGYKNYEKVAIAYIKGDIEKEEFILAGKKLEEGINSINVLPDKGVVNGVKTAINSLQKETGALSAKIKKIEEENQKYNS